MVMKRRVGITVAFACAVLMAVYMFALPVEAAQIDSRFVGMYKGFFNGEADYGTFEMAIEPGGNITGTGKSAKSGDHLVYSGTCQPGGTFQFKATDGSIVFNGAIDWMNRLEGKWNKGDNSAQGSFGGVPSSLGFLGKAFPGLKGDRPVIGPTPFFLPLPPGGKRPFLDCTFQ